MLCLLRKRRSSLLISLPFSPFISAPFRCFFASRLTFVFCLSSSPFFYERAQLAPYELTHVRPSPGDWAAGWAQRTKRHARFESSEALAELPAVARTAVELHECCARVTFACRGFPLSNTIYIDGVARASSAGTNGSSARSLVLHAILAPVASSRERTRLERSEDQLGLETTTKRTRTKSYKNRGRLRHGQLQLAWRIAVGDLPTSSASARSSCSSRNWVLRREPETPPDSRAP